MTVLVLTAADDDTATRVQDALHERGRDTLRADPGDFPRSVSFSAHGPAPGWSGHMDAGGRRLPLSDVSGVYHRRPSAFRPAPGLDEQSGRFAVGEAGQAWTGLMSCFTVPFVNRPSRVIEAERKLTQLVVAGQVGFRVPRTLITTTAAHARDFVRTTAQVVYKPLKAPFLHDGVDARLVYATLVGTDDLDDGSIGVAPCQFQEFIPKRHDVRLIAVGRRCLATAILAGSERAYVDWRADYPSLSYEVLTPPPGIARAVHAYLVHFGLAFGCFDFAVGPGPDGVDTWWFLECGPNAQWGWIEHETGLPIAAALADHLIGRAA